MILVCPSCDAKFKVPDGAIPPGGRTVRCAKCKNSWHADAKDALRKPAPVVRPAVASVQAPRRPQMPAGPQQSQSFDGTLGDRAAADTASLRRSATGPQKAAMTARDDNAFPAPAGGGLEDEGTQSDDFGVSSALKASGDDDFVDGFSDDGTHPDGPDANDDVHDPDYDEDDYDEDDFLARRRAEQRRQSLRDLMGRDLKLKTILTGGLLVFWLFIFYVFIFQSENMRYYFPGTSNAVYGLLEGLDDRDRFRPKDGEKLTPSNAVAKVYVRALLLPPPRGLSVETRSGREGLMLRGYVENTGKTGANVPQVRAAILDKNNQELDSWIFNPIGLILRRDQKLNFEEFRSPIPPGAYKAEVKVIEGSKSNRDARDVPGAPH